MNLITYIAPQIRSDALRNMIHLEKKEKGRTNKLLPLLNSDITPTWRQGSLTIRGKLGRIWYQISTGIIYRSSLSDKDKQCKD
jgi:hypothetical protein